MKTALFSFLALFASLASTQTPAQPLPPAAARTPGLYVSVLDGAITLSNPAGTTNFSAGQFGFTPSFTQPPVVVPTNPGLPFTPPPVFNSTTGTALSSSSGSNSGAVDCIVR